MGDREEEGGSGEVKGCAVGCRGVTSRRNGFLQPLAGVEEGL